MSKAKWFIYIFIAVVIGVLWFASVKSGPNTAKINKADSTKYSTAIDNYKDIYFKNSKKRKVKQVEKPYNDLSSDITASATAYYIDKKIVRYEVSFYEDDGYERKNYYFLNDGIIFSSLEQAKYSESISISNDVAFTDYSYIIIKNGKKYNWDNLNKKVFENSVEAKDDNEILKNLEKMYK